MKSPASLLFLAVVLGAVAPSAGAGPVPGARETFFNVKNADAWTVFDYFDNDTYYGNREETAGDGWLSFPYTGDQPFQFFADASVAGGAFTGNYSASGIRSASVDVFVPVLEEFDQLDCFLFCNGPAGIREYYSGVVIQEDLTGGSGWYELNFVFRDIWFYYDNEAGQYIPFAPGPEFPSGVQEIGFRFFPVDGIAATSFAGIDNVTLLPDMRPPVAEPARAGGSFSLTFTPPAGLQCQVESLDAGGASWSPVAGQTGIAGPDPHTFQVPVTASRALYRIRSEAVITEVVTP